MDALFEVLRSSTDNNARRAAAAQLRQLQSEQPDAFLRHTYDGIASAQLQSELRFFLCTLVLAFLEESWHNGVPPALQERYTALYVQLVISQPFPSVLLARKVGLIVAVMARRGSRKAQVGGLPPVVDYVVAHYVAELTSAAHVQAYDRVFCLLLSVHLLLKEIQGCRVGHIFEDVCRAMVAPLSCVFALLPDATAMLAHYDVCLYLLKCSLRTFGRAVFDASFSTFLLRTTWRLTEGLGGSADGDMSSTEAVRRLRLLEYALKILEATVVYFPSRLQELGADFFFVDTSAFDYGADGNSGNSSSGGGVDSTAATAAGTLSSASAAPPSSSSSLPATSQQSLFALLVAVVCSPVETVVSEKAVCRALRLFTTLLSAEDGDSFIAHCLHRFAASPVFFSPFLQHVISAFLADSTTAEALAAWVHEPERVAAELDVDMDDAASPMSCAEQVFLAFTGSTQCAAAALAAAWEVVHNLLQAGEPAAITAALHAIGIGYYTMAAEDKTAYLDFLRARLLPLLQPNTLAQTSPFIARRVVWLVGMWCESVTDTRDRHTVLAALEAVLEHALQTRNLVLVLVSLKAMENFISDNTFARSDVTATLVTTLLQTVELVLTAVHSPTTIKELAGLVHVLIEKGVMQARGEVLLQLFAPPAQDIIHSYELQAAKASAAATSCSVGVDDMAEDEEADDAVSSLSMLLECIGSSVRQCRNDTVLWSLFPSIVQPCIAPTCAATPWAEDNAWELLLTMVQSSCTFAAAAAAQALPAVLQHTHRDFSFLPLVFRSLYSLLLLRQEAVDDIVAPADVDAWVAIVRDSPSAELCGAVTAALTTVARMSAGPLRVALSRHAVHALLTSADVQADTHTVPLAVALALSVASAASAGDLHGLLAELHTAVAACGGGGPQPSMSAVLEPLVLLLDVSPSALVNRALASLLHTCVEVAPQSISTEDREMVQRAVEGVVAAAAVSSAAGGVVGGSGTAQSACWAGDEVEEIRSPQEMLLEWLGDENVPATSPHISRVMSTFAVLLS